MFKIIRKILSYFLIFVLASFAIWLGHLFTGGRDAAILMYHSIGEPVPESENLNMGMDVFEWQMKYLHDNKYNVIPMEELLRNLKEKKPVPPKTVVLTFDDGYENNYRKVFPVLKKYRFPAVIFIPIDFIGVEKEFFGHRYRFLDKKMIKEMSDSGLVVFGSHALDHKQLTLKKSQSSLRKEIFDSKLSLEKITGKKADLFCYPCGVYDEQIEKVVREAGYAAALTTFPKEKGFAHSDIFALKRIKPTKIRSKFVFFIQTSGYYMRMREG
ncbi:MAG TPA: polysaccharide deacetylase family protein [Candidatus Omnitrophota bacterium]|nr:polysaccharide deacetylase family protein [Candidatus Omnitrophota bacterium]